MICEIYAVGADAEKSLVGARDFLVPPQIDDQVQVDDDLYVVVGRRIHDLEGDFRGLVELFVKGTQ